jgi:hypothetical protein
MALARAALFGVAILAACGGSETVCPDDEPALVVAVTSSGPGDTCVLLSSDIANYGVDVTIGDVMFSRPDAIAASQERFIFAWPSSVDDGEEGVVAFFATGDGVTATGTATFAAATAECQGVALQATCEYLSGQDAGVDHSSSSGSMP